ncbi:MULTISPECIES: hypothetical protein [Pseudomonas]|uniref:hypothetical protein n=1 Tax=Pseudomonas TaxID=286 RepID=UPI000BA285F6|nr:MULTISPECIES: hypothetical protein [Pseudomonas]PAA00053.1 hypothetical protein CJU76_22950 [Pseudomonas fragi]
MSIVQDVTNEVVKSAPPVAVTSAIIMGMTINEWAAAATLCYVCLQAFFLIRNQPKKESKKEHAKPVKPDDK